jgi:hypothetical protein
MDACRDSAALSDFAVYGSLDQHKNRTPVDWAIYFSCSRDSTAKDGPSGGHSPFVAELLHDAEGIFAQGVPLGKGLNDACDRLRRQQSDQFAFGIRNAVIAPFGIAVRSPDRVPTIPDNLYLFPPDSDASSMAGIKGVAGGQGAAEGQEEVHPVAPASIPCIETWLQGTIPYYPMSTRYGQVETEGVDLTSETASLEN